MNEPIVFSSFRHSVFKMLHVREKQPSPSGLYSKTSSSMKEKVKNHHGSWILFLKVLALKTVSLLPNDKGGTNKIRLC